MGIFSTFTKTKPVPATTQIWDKHFYTKLVDDTDDVTADLIWQSFRNALAGSMEEWKAAMAAKDYSKIRQIAHKTRSSSMLLGFKEFAGLNQKIEQYLTDNTTNPSMDEELSHWIDEATSVLEVLDERPKNLLG